MDPEKNFAVIKKSSEKETINIISLGKFKNTWERDLQKSYLRHTFANDGSFFAEYNDESIENEKTMVASYPKASDAEL